MSRELQTAVELIVCDTLHFAGFSPLKCASLTKSLTPLVMAESHGVEQLRAALAATTQEEADGR